MPLTVPASTRRELSPATTIPVFRWTRLWVRLTRRGKLTTAIAAATLRVLSPLPQTRSTAQIDRRTSLLVTKKVTALTPPFFYPSLLLQRNMEQTQRRQRNPHSTSSLLKISPGETVHTLYETNRYGHHTQTSEQTTN